MDCSKEVETSELNGGNEVLVTTQEVSKVDDTMMEF